jgi:hypothetical protein
MKTDQMNPPSKLAAWQLADDTTISLRDSCLKHKCLASAFRLGWAESFRLQKHEWSVRSSSKLCGRASETDVYVMAFGGNGFDGMLPQRVSVCKTLWDADVKARAPFGRKGHG